MNIVQVYGEETHEALLYSYLFFSDVIAWEDADFVRFRRNIKHWGRKTPNENRVYMLDSEEDARGQHPEPPERSLQAMSYIQDKGIKDFSPPYSILFTNFSLGKELPELPQHVQIGFDQNDKIYGTEISSRDFFMALRGEKPHEKFPPLNSVLNVALSATGKEWKEKFWSLISSDPAVWPNAARQLLEASRSQHDWLNMNLSGMQ